MKTLSIIIIFLFSLFETSCRKFQTEFSHVAVRCEASPESIPADYQSFQVFQPDGAPLKPELVPSLKIRFLQDSGVVSEPKPTPSACIFLPKAKGQLQIYETTSQLYLIQTISGSDQNHAFPLQLKTFKAGELNLECPKGGYFVSGELPNPVDLKGASDLDSWDYRLSLVRDGVELNLAQKASGLNLDLQETVALGSEVAEGSYSLRLHASNFIHEWTGSGIFPIRECALHYQKTRPLVRSSMPVNTDRDSRTVLTVGTPIGFYAESQIPADVYTCHEKISDDEDLAQGETNECAAKNLCQNADNFQLLTSEKAREPGLYHYFTYARDRAGLKSDVSCTKVIVSDAAPKINVSWNKKEWNTPLYVMKTAALDVQAKASFSHSELSDSVIGQTLECKVDFARFEHTEIDGEDVLCTSGRCKGRTLKDFTPCDSDIRFSIAEYWNTQATQRIKLRLTVRVKAENNTSETAEAVVWIYPERFAPTSTHSVSEKIDTIFEAKDGTIFGTASPYLYQWDEAASSWRKSELPTTLVPKKVRMTQTMSSEIYAFWSRDDVSEAAHWKDGAWVIIASHPLLKACLVETIPHPIDGFYCAQFDDTILWQNESWEEIKLPNKCKLYAPKPNKPSVFADKDGNSFVACISGPILRQKKGSSEWQSLSSKQPAPQYGLDEKGRVWEFNNFAGQDSLAYYEHERWITVSKRPKLRVPGTIPQMFSLNGKIYFDEYVWDDETSDWVVPEESGMAFPNSRLLPISAEGNRTIYDTGLGYLVKEGSRETYYPLKYFGLTKDPLKFPFVDKSGRLWFLTDLSVLNQRTVYRTALTQWHRYTEEAKIRSRPDILSVVPLWFNEWSLPEYSYLREGMIRLAKETWTRIYSHISSDEQVLSYFGRSGDGEYYGWSWDKIYHYDVDGRNVRLDPGRDAGTISLQNQTDYRGRLWVDGLSSEKTWLLDKKSMIPAFLPVEAGFKANKEFLFLYDRLLLVASQRVFRWDEEARAWKESDAEREGLPSKTIFRKLASPRHLVHQAEGEAELTLTDLSTRGTSKIALPPVKDANGVYRFANGFLYLLDRSKGLYVWRDNLWIPLLSQTEVFKHMNLDVSVSFEGLTFDAYHRAWITGRPFQLIRYDFD